jgi:ribonuclease HI
MAAHNRIRRAIPTIAGTSDTVSSHYAWARKLSDESGINNIPSDVIIPHFHAHKEYACVNEQYIAFNDHNPCKLQIFTDGSRIKINDNLGHTGCGFIIYGSNQEVLHEKASYLGTMSSIFQAEVFAIGQAAHYVQEIQIEIDDRITDIDIVTDSKAALLALDGILTSSKLVKDCMAELDKLQQRFRVTIHWTKAHVGHLGNEKADELAKLGTKKISYAVEPILPVPKTWNRKKIKEYITNEWTSRWASIPEARQTKIFFPKPNAKLSKKLLSYDRQTCAKLFRWISGHSFHNYHNNLLHPEKFISSKCRACDLGREETSHLFAYCNGLAQIRMKILGCPTLAEQFLWSPHQLLSMIREVDGICPELGTADLSTPNNGTLALTNTNDGE